jgi:uncharacterized protein
LISSKKHQRFRGGFTMANSSNSSDAPLQKKIKPVKEGLFHIPNGKDDEPYLIGSKCRACGLISWPKRPVCPACVRDDTEEEIILSKRARLVAFSLVGQKPEGFMYPIPFVQGNVQLPEGPILYTVVDADVKGLRLGQEMEMFLDKIAEGFDGIDIISYKYRPVNDTEGD